MEPTLAIVLLVAALGALVVLVAAGLVSRRGRRSSEGGHQSRIAALAARLEERDRQKAALEVELEEARREREEALGDLRRAEADLAAERAEHKARTEELARARASLDTEFKGLAASVLQDSTDSLLRQAKAQFESHQRLSDAELAKRQQAVDNLVRPIQATLEKFDAHTSEVEKQRVGAYEGLSSQITALQRVAGSLSEALRSPNIRGQWAEQELGNILELSGLRQHIDYVPQPTVSVAAGRLRPDAVVNVPGGLKVVIDAKAPLDNYLKAHEAGDSSEESVLMARHAEAVWKHASDLGKREYAAAIAGSPDFVLMFVPADPILDAAMKVQPTLWEQAWQQHGVLIATPGLLLAFLRTVALAWQQQDMQENAQEIAGLGKELYDRLRVFADHMEDMGTGLGKALVAYNRGVGSLEGRVLTQARRFEDLAAIAGTKVTPRLAQVEDVVRPMSARRGGPGGVLGVDGGRPESLSA